MKGKNNQSIGLEPIKRSKYLPKSDNIKRASRYNNSVMGDIAFEAKSGFSNRLAERRSIKGISAREMSLALGQGASYINDIENGRTLPSLAMFFEICEYLEITPLEFFVYTADQSIPYDKDLATLIGMLSKKDKEWIKGLAERLIR